MKRPLVLFCVCLCWGIVWADIIQSILWIVFATALLASVVVYISRSYSDYRIYAFLGLIMFLIGYFTHSWVMFKIYTKYSRWKNEYVVVEGWVIEDPLTKNDRISCVLRTENLHVNEDLVRIRGKIYVSVYTNSPEELNLTYGSHVALSGKLRLPNKARNPGGFDYRKYLAGKKISAVMYIDKTKLEILKGKKKSWLLYTGYILRERILKAIKQSMPKEQAGLLSGMLIGYREDLSKSLEDAFINSGLTHIMAVSGANVAFILLPLLFLLKKLGIRKRIANILSIAVLVVFVCITGFEASVLRASLMAVIFLTGEIINRESDIYQSLSLSAIILLLINPFILFNVGFQLSYIATLSLALLYKKIESLFPKKLPKMLKDTLSATLAAQLGVMPFLAVYFNKVSLISLFSNLLVVPLTGLITVAGFILAAASIISSVLGQLIAYPLTAFLSVVLYVTKWSANIPYAAVQVVTPKIWWIIVYYLLICIFFININFKFCKKESIVAGILLFSGILIFINQIITNSFTVTFVDVGQGDCALIKTHNNKTVLIDGGGNRYDAEDSFVGEKIVVPFLLDQGIQHINRIVATHGHTDHIGGLISVIEKLKVDELIIPESFDKKAFEGLIENAIRKNVKVIKVNNSFFVDIDKDTSLKVIYPTAYAIEKNFKNLNNHSVVCFLKYKGIKFLFTGDLETEGEKLLLAENDDIKTNVLKVGHHGAKDASSIMFLKACLPDIAVISVGRNRFGHPAPKVIEKLKMIGARVFMTSETGAISIKVNKDRLKIITTLQPDVFIFER